MKKLLLLFLLTGCGIETHGSWTGTICTTPEFSDDQNILIYQATQEWRDRSNDSVDLQVKFLNDHDENGCDAVIYDSSPPEGGGVGVTEAPGTQGYTTYIYLDPNMSMVDQLPDQVNSNDFYSVSLHELGHYLGAMHSPYCNDIMYWKVNGYYHLSDNDVNQLWHPYPNKKYDQLTYCLNPDGSIYD